MKEIVKENKVISKETAMKIKQIIADLEKDMEELNRIKERIKLKKIKIPSPQENKRLIEEIIVPPLELLHEKKK